MKNKFLTIIFATFFVLISFNSTFAQSFCDAAGDATADNTSLAWKLRPETKGGNWATSMKPVIQEMQRLFPQSPKGLEITYGIFDAMDIKVAKPNDIQYYESFFMIKDIVCYKHQGKNQIEPEGETGNWIYFRANSFNLILNNYVSKTNFTLPSTDLSLYAASDIRIEENKNGMKSVYIFNEDNEQKFAAWYFSDNKILPYRRISKLEFAQSYREYWLKKTEEEIKRLEGVLATSQKTFARVSAEKGVMTEAEKQKFFQSLREGDQKTQQYIDRYKTQRENAISLTDKILQSPDAQKEAHITNFNEILSEPKEIRFGDGKGVYVYIENREIFDKTLPKWQPQFMIVRFRRPDVSPAKTAFNKKVEDEFDFNVVRKMVGLKPMPQMATISNLGSTQGGYTSGKIENATTENSASESADGVLFNENFDDSIIGQAPNKWTVSNNTAIVRNNSGANWLVMKKEGLFFPDYSTLLLPKDFTLEFDLSWNKEISYYSPSFYFHIGAARYDNTLKRYDRAQVNVNSYTSAAMERVAIWIDPYWNDFGRYGVDVFDNRGGYLTKKADKTSIFFKDKNRVKVKVVRKGAMLTLFFNGTKITEEAVMGENIRWNFFGFGLSNAPNAAESDEFYVGNIRLIK